MMWSDMGRADDGDESIMLSHAELLHESLQRLSGEWREACEALGLRSGTSWSGVAELLGLDRGTAQRLVRLGGADEVSGLDLDYVPGTAAWQKVLAGTEKQLGPDHRAQVRLALACDRFDEALSALGGSKASAKRALASGARVGGLSSVSAQRSRAKSRWVDAAAEYVGYRVEQRADITFVRRNPKRLDKLDIAMVILFRGCTGEPWALPFTLARYASQDGESPLQSSSEPAFRLLSSVTTSPPPAVLSTGDSERQTVFIEPSWMELPGTLDIGVMIRIEGTMPLPWLDDPKQLILTSLMRQPAESYRSEAFLEPEVDAVSSVNAFSCYRDLSVLGLTRHWFDRLPETAPIEELGAFGSGSAGRSFAGYDGLVDELRINLDWGLDTYVGYGASVDMPVPFARYSMEFECRAPEA